ncbi:nicotinate-nucleotide diphosphorylase (carboxylating) [Dimargaris cristalligena]|uniref:Nicotinate-nucleotide pyrophosphorylase [carboxylating] n=1 Tax=Dimargaris cristalligena TaxID=215637 RepID=A0A4P9ZV70_9FUNG|nr:nicotinate-nucleotide diphosphorylase (carboxylating) [Dimargaris cristalligena]RKP37168.1 nicotinate-nucleotide diphosphorylase [Dimargaris cristalligena]|eukprot:RKP37168.1 nicotinate-nucleotide diphosphorylase [Dimargaris cristalligena]
MSSTNQSTSPSFEHLLPPHWSTLVTEWLKEDTPSFDYGGFVVGEKEETAVLLGKSPGVVAGKPFFDQVFSQLGCRVEWIVPEGESFEPITKVAYVYGPARQLLMGERVALNMLARCSGIATRARRLRSIKEAHGFQGIIAGTRKTTPGFRIVEKYAMLVGGIDTHRMDLSSSIMLKDNHIWSQGSITAAVHKARQAGGFSIKIEVECQSEAEADEAITAGADIVMLDNFDGPGLQAAAESLRQRWTRQGRPDVLIEASGGITEETIADYFSPHINIISLGSVTQGVPHVDFSLKIQKKQ